MYRANNEWVVYKDQYDMGFEQCPTWPRDIQRCYDSNGHKPKEKLNSREYRGVTRTMFLCENCPAVVQFFVKTHTSGIKVAIEAYPPEDLLN